MLICSPNKYSTFHILDTDTLVTKAVDLPVVRELVEKGLLFNYRVLGEKNIRRGGISAFKNKYIRFPKINSGILMTNGSKLYLFFSGSLLYSVYNVIDIRGIYTLNDILTINISTGLASNEYTIRYNICTGEYTFRSTINDLSGIKFVSFCDESTFKRMVIFS